MQVVQARSTHEAMVSVGPFNSFQPLSVMYAAVAYSTRMLQVPRVLSMETELSPSFRFEFERMQVRQGKIVLYAGLLI